jgi:hypothetical protein
MHVLTLLCFIDGMIKDAVREASLLKKHETADQALFASLKSTVRWFIVREKYYTMTDKPDWYNKHSHSKHLLREKKYPVK